MRLTLDRPGDINSVRSYDTESVTLGSSDGGIRTLRAPCVLASRALIIDWPAPSLSGLRIDHLDVVFSLEPQIVIAGTHARERLASAAIRKLFRERGVALESMELGAACRTFNVLVQEERLVVALLFP